MRRFVTRFLRDETAATSVEYGVMLVLILGAVFAAVILLGQDARQLWTQNSTNLQSAGVGS